MIRILDTDVISALRRPDRAPAVARWLEREDEDSLYLSAITIGEVARRIELQRSRNTADFAPTGVRLENPFDPA